MSQNRPTCLTPGQTHKESFMRGIETAGQLSQAGRGSGFKNMIRWLGIREEGGNQGGSYRRGLILGNGGAEDRINRNNTTHILTLMAKQSTRVFGLHVWMSSFEMQFNLKRVSKTSLFVRGGLIHLLALFIAESNLLPLQYGTNCMDELSLTTGLSSFGWIP